MGLHIFDMDDNYIIVAEDINDYDNILLQTRRTSSLEIVSSIECE